MNYNTLRNKPTINHKEIIGNTKASDIGGLTAEEMEQLITTDLTSYYTKDQIDDLFSRSFVYREKSGSIVTFDCPSTSQTIPEVTTEIVAIQAGTGDPSPTNVRPISGWSAVNVYDGPTTDPQDATVYTIDLGGTRYGGTLDVVSGELTVDRAYVDLGTLSWSYSTLDGRFFTTNIKDIKKVMGASIVMNGLCSHYDIVAYQYVHKSTALDGIMGLFSTSTTNYLAIKDTRYTDATAFKTALEGVQLVYELATPQTIQLTPTAVKSLLGTNNLWADSGDITVKALDKIIQG